MTSRTSSVVLWDHSEPPPNDRHVLLWKGYEEKNNQQSILKYLEKNSDQLRSEYINYIYDIGQMQVQGKRIIEHLEVEPGFSFWWMSLLVEKSPTKTKAPIDCLRLLAVNHFLSNNKPNSIELVSSNKNLAKALQQLCSRLNIHFVWNYLKYSSEPFSFKTIIKKLPHLVKSPLFLMRQLISRWSLRKINDVNWFKGEDALFFFSYFFALDQESCESGRFYSRQWEVLPIFLRHYGKKLNWIHHFFLSSVVPDTKTGNDWLRTFNANAISEGRHNFLDSFLTIGIVGRTITTLSRIVLRISFINRRINYQMYKCTKGWLWPLLLDDWKNSIFGTAAVQNILWFYLFDRAISSLPKQKTGLYLSENQGWEQAFIYFWKKYGHGNLIAVPHATIRYWDLRYFDDPKVWNSKDILAQPLPDKIAINGAAAWEMYENANQPMDKMFKVEALRYLHLGKLEPSINNSDKKVVHVMKKLLIFGDIKKSTTNSMLELLNSISPFLSDGWDMTLKPHPANQVKVENYPNLSFVLTDTPLEQLLPNFEITIASIYTSAALEAFSAGLNVITILDDDDFNFSPLRGIQGVHFVSTAGELKVALLKCLSKPFLKNTDVFFWTDSELPKWKSLLNLIQ